MQPVIVKGVLESCQYVTKYDDDGNEYKQYSFRINGKSYDAKLPRDLYLGEGTNLILAIDPNKHTEVLSGYSIKDGSNWGENVKLLKSNFSEEETYEYLEGVVIEKRKFSSRTFDQSRETYGSNTYYDILLGNRKFSASGYLGENLKPGMHIATVLINDAAYLIQDTNTGKIKGLAKPYYVLFLLSMIVYTGAMMYYRTKTSSVLPNFNVGLIVINIFLFLAAVLNFYTYKATQRMKNFLKQKQKVLK